MTAAATGVLVGDRIEVADSFGSRLLGLMFRSGLGEGEGLLLRRADAIHMCFMRFPIDAVFLDAECRVVKVAERLRPWLGIASAEGAAHVLELSAGRAAACGLEKGAVLRCSEPEAVPEGPK